MRKFPCVEAEMVKEIRQILENKGVDPENDKSRELVISIENRFTLV